MTTERGMRIKVSEAYAWMRAAQEYTERQGGFVTTDLAHCRGYTQFQASSRKLGYIERRPGCGSVWIPDSVTMVMAEILHQEYHNAQQAATQRRFRAKREVQINEQVNENSQPLSEKEVAEHREKFINPTPAPTPSWWQRIFGKSEPAVEPKAQFDDFMREVFSDEDMLAIQKLDEINARVTNCERILEAMGKELNLELPEQP